MSVSKDFIQISDFLTFIKIANHFFREGKKITEATYGKEYKLQAEMDKPSGNLQVIPRTSLKLEGWLKGLPQILYTSKAF